jgi:SAM-dependent methyltransferase
VEWARLRGGGRQGRFAVVSPDFAEEKWMTYDPQAVRFYFDEYGTQEWKRLEQTLQGRIKYAIHRRFLEKFVPAGAHVLDAGCGPGRFALDLARRGCTLTLVDLSPTQLDLARQRLETARLLDIVQAFHCLDMVDMHELGDESFDAVVCYGAALSYTYDRYETALGELVRVLRPGGPLLISVDSLYGTLRLIGPLDAEAFLEAADAHMDWEAALTGAGVAYTRPGSPEFHQAVVMFTADGLVGALERAGLEVVATGAANPLVSTCTQIPRITASAQASAELTRLELALCDRPELLDAGEHVLAAAFKR